MGSMFEIMNSGNTHRVDYAQWEGANQMRVANNEKEAALANLKNFQITEGNKRRNHAAGKEYNVHMDNLTKSLNQTIGTDMNFQLAGAHSMGSLAAQAAAAGVGGSSVDLLDSLTALQTDVQLQATKDERNSLAIFGSRTAASVMDNAYAQIDNSQHFGNYDYTTQLEPKKLKNKWGAMIGVGVATYFGGPMAGQAAADMVMGSWKANNGDFGAASEYYAAAAKNAVGAFQEWQSLQDGESNKSWWSAVRDRNTESKNALRSAQSDSTNQSEGTAFGFSTFW